MRLNQFPSCCGAGILHSLDYWNGSPFREQLKEKIKQAIRNDWGMIFVITNAEQRGRVITLVSKGFKKISTFKNPKHNSTLSVWALNLNKVKL